MKQKIVKVGTSAMVTIPREVMEQYDWKIGDSINVESSQAEPRVSITSDRSDTSIKEVVEWTDKFIKRYRQALEALAKK